MVKDVIAEDYDSAIGDVLHADFYDSKSDLLKYLELGTIHYIKKEYYLALSFFDKAMKLGEELHTVSVSKKLATVVVNDTFDKYYGSSFELSMARFYASLCHYHLYEQGFYEPYHAIDSEEKSFEGKSLTENERKKHMWASRSVVIDWSKLLKTLSMESAGNPIYKDDVLNRIYSAFINETVNGKKGRQSALKLYEDARDILLKNYSLYPTFNSRYKEFSEQFSSFNDADKKTISDLYVQKTHAYEVLSSFIDRQIKRLKTESKNKDNVKIVVKDSLVSGKEIDKFFVPLPVTFIRRHRDFSSFVSATVALGAISFEFPKIWQRPAVEPFKIRVFDESGNEVYTGDLPVVNPMSDIAYQTFKSEEAGIKSKIVARNLGKHMAALVAAYGVYKSSGKDSFFGIMGAGLTYSAASMAIASSEKADVRSWRTMAGNIFATSFALLPGEYTLVVYDSEYHELGTESITVTENNRIYDINLPLHYDKMPRYHDGNDYYYLDEDYDYQVVD